MDGRRARHREVSGPTLCRLRSAGAARQAIDVEERHGATLQADPTARHEVGERLVDGLARSADQLGQLFLREVVGNVDALVGRGAEAVGQVQEGLGDAAGDAENTRSERDSLVRRRR